MILYQKKLFTDSECLKIRSYIIELKDRVIGTYHPTVNNGEHDPSGGHNLADHLPWSSSDEYDWVKDRIIEWCNSLNLPYTIVNLGWEFIIQKYIEGFEFKPHIDDVLSPDKKTIVRKRYYTILIQLGSTREYGGGELWVNNGDDIKISQEQGNVCLFGHGQLHWVTPITSGERWSCTIFLEKDALKKSIL
jgi:hypothetical protein